MPAKRGPAVPWTSSQFWLLQLIVLAVSLGRVALSVALHLDANSPAIEFTTVALFLIPVVFAALNFGFSGAVVTSSWVAILSVPRFVLYVDAGNVSGAWAEMMQVVVLNVLAFLVGQRVTAEQEARGAAEIANEAHHSAEALYRDLFDSNQAPILIVDGGGRVVEANASAHRVFPQCVLPSSGLVAPTADPDADDPPSPRLIDVIGPKAAGQVLTRLVAPSPDPAVQADPDRSRPVSAEQPWRVDPLPFELIGGPVLFRPTATVLPGSDGSMGIQIVFEDVTVETHRHERMEAYAAQVVSGQEEERRHIAQELHDGPVQSLIHLCRQIDAVDTMAPAAANQAMAELRATTEATVAELRQIAKGLRPPILDDLGLPASINQMLVEIGQRNRFETSFGITGRERRLPPGVELALFRISQEALSNVERHAKPTRVAIELAFAADGIRLRIQDDGIGFDATPDPAEVAGTSLGLPGMAERAHLIGATFGIRTGPGDGTSVEVWLPDQ